MSAAGLSERLLTARQFCEHRPAFTQNSLRWLLFTRKRELEKAGAVIRIGTGKRQRVLIDPLSFDKWLLCGEAGR